MQRPLPTSPSLSTISPFLLSSTTVPLGYSSRGLENIQSIWNLRDIDQCKQGAPPIIRFRRKTQNNSSNDYLGENNSTEQHSQVPRKPYVNQFGHGAIVLQRARQNANATRWTPQNLLKQEHGEGSKRECHSHVHCREVWEDSLDENSEIISVKDDRLNEGRESSASVDQLTSETVADKSHHHASPELPGTFFECRAKYLEERGLTLNQLTGKYARRAPGCTELFPTKSSLGQHVRCAHQGIGAFTCKVDGCGKQFVRLGNLKKHLRKGHQKITPVHCDVPGCGRRLKNALRLALHRKSVHINTARIQCDVPGCRSVFKRTQIRKHKKTVHETITRVLCDVPGCDAILKGVRNFTSHKENVHEKTKRILCDVLGCGKTLKNKKYLPGHKRAVHGNVIRIQCDVLECDKLLKGSKSLARHKETVHSSNARITCDVPGCEATLKSAKYLPQHKENVHEALVSIQCDVDNCEKILKSFRSYVRHKEIMHGLASVTA